MELIVRHGEREEKVHLERTEAGYRVTIGDAGYTVDVARAGDAHGPAATHSLLIGGRQHEVTVRRRQGSRDEHIYRVSTASGAEEVGVMDPLTYLARSTHEASGGGVQQVTAYMPGRVAEILVEEGDEVVAGQGIVVLEAMKMKNEIQAEAAGVVRRILVEQDQAVEGGDPLFEIG